MKFANELHDNLTRKGISVLLDDREERAGVKFNDMDLIGIPVRVTIGKKFADGNVELKLRTEDSATDVSINEIESKIEELVKELMK
jgi:prolyl-tRNA synthetase